MIPPKLINNHKCTFLINILFNNNILQYPYIVISSSTVQSSRTCTSN